MKKFLIILVLFVSIMGTVHSQSKLGFRGSFDVVSMSTSQVKSRPSFSLGAIYSKEFADQWYFQPSLLFSLNASRASDLYKRNQGHDFSANYYSVETPLILSYRWGDEDISLGLDFGAFARYGIFGKYWVSSAEGRIKPELFDSHKRFDAGPQIGFSAIVSGLYFGYSFQYGLIKPWQSMKGNYYTSSITIGYLFDIY